MNPKRYGLVAGKKVPNRALHGGLAPAWLPPAGERPRYEQENKKDWRHGA